MSPRDNLCTTDDGDAILHVHSTVVVWWYERIRRNPYAQTIPTVDVVFRFLDKDDRLAGVTVIPIGVSRMGSFRIGTIWKDGKCIAEADFGKAAEFGDSTRTWTPIPRTLGQRLHADLDTHSTATWTLIPQALGQ